MLNKIKKFISLSILLLLLLTVSGQNNSIVNVLKSSVGIIKLGDKLEIFVDNYLIEKLDGTRLVLHQPVDRGAVFYFNRPWEGKTSAYVTIINDNGLFRAYYRGSDSKNKKEDKVIQSACYAESRDGIHWEKPNLALVEFKGSRQNNILTSEEPDSHNFCPFIDTNPKVTSGQKYKALAGDEKKGLAAFVSPDGIHWERLQDEPIIKDGMFDSQNVAFWSESENCYVCYFRTWTGGGFKGFRSVSRATSNDFLHWSEPVAVTFGNTPQEHLYTQQTSPYFRAPHFYIAIGARFVPDRRIVTDEQAIELAVDPTQLKGISDAYFMTSRGGNAFDRMFMESFIRPGIGLNNWTARTNYPALNVVQTSPEEMSIYVSQDYGQPTVHLNRYTLRIDGFTSVHAPYSSGELITKPFTFSGDVLEFNYSTSSVGEIRVEVQDMNGNPIPGFTMDDSQVLIGNEIAGIVLWNGSGKVTSLANKPVRLHIYMKDADLYSIRFKKLNFTNE